MKLTNQAYFYYFVSLSSFVISINGMTEGVGSVTSGSKFGQTIDQLKTYPGKLWQGTKGLLGFYDLDLLTAIKNGDIDGVKMALSKGASPNARGKKYEVCDMEEGCEYFNGPSALDIAVALGNKDIVDILLQQKANPNAQKDSHYQSVLGTAIEAGHWDIAKDLVTHGANVDAMESYGYSGRGPTLDITLLQQAVKKNDIETARKLLELGASPTIRSRGEAGGKTALDMANDPKMWQVLKETRSTLGH